MKKTITITDGMETPLIQALNAQKMHDQKIMELSEENGWDYMRQTCEKEIQAIDQMLEKLRRAKWRT